VAVLDHVAVGTGTLAPGWELFGAVLGGTWAYGGHSPGFWWGQLQYAAGPKVELLTPTGGPDAAFLERFLADRGPGFHHLNFLVPAIEVTLGKLRTLGVEPVAVSLQNPHWKEAFVRPRDGHGTVIQVAEQADPPLTTRPPPGLGEPGPPSSLTVIEQQVADIDGAARLFEEALDGKIVDRTDTAAASVAELCWSNGATLRLLQPRSGTPPAEGIVHLQFSRGVGTFGAADRNTAALLSRRLGISVRLGN